MATVKLLLATVLAGMAGLAGADTPAADNARIGAAIEQAKETVLGVQYRFESLAADIDTQPEAPVYFGSRAPKLGVAGVSVTVSDKPAAQRQFDPEGHRGLYRVGALPISPRGGPIEAFASIVDGQDGRRIAVRTDADAPPLAGADIIELVLEPGGWLSSPELVLHRWRPDPGLTSETSEADDAGIRRFLPGSAADPRLRHALTLADTGEAERAVVRLLRIKAGLPADVSPPDALLWALAETSLQAELPGSARRLARQLAGREVDPTRLDRLRLQIGDAYLARGEIDTARDYVAGRQPAPGLRLEWQALIARIHLAAGDYPAAAAVFENPEALFFEVRRNLEQPKPAQKLAAYSRYNRAVAFVRSGTLQRGLTWLDIVGRMRSFDPETRALRDQANVALGWQLLRQGAGLAAARVFNRVQLDGPFSDAALLGAGWAMLGPAGEDVARDQGQQLGAALENSALPDYVVEMLIKRRVLDPNVYGQESLRTRIGRIEKPDDEQAAAKAALRFWLELADGDIRTAAVQEGLLAIAMAYGLLGDRAQSAEYYGRAVERFEQSLNQLASAHALVADESSLGAFLEDFASSGPAFADAGPAQAWVARAAVEATDLRYIDRYRKLDQLTTRIHRISRRIDALSAAPANDPQLRSLRQPLQRARQAIDDVRAREQARTQTALDAALAASETRLRGYLEAAYAGRLQILEVAPGLSGPASSP